MKTAAVCIATYRRDFGLERLLNALQRQAVPDGWAVEIRIVNNDPSASPTEWPSRVRTAHPEAMTRIERRRNIAHARNSAIRMGRADAILFIDDDEVPAAGWLTALLSRMNDADAAFGPVIGRVPETSSRWLLRAGVFDKPGPDHDGEIDWTQSRTSSTAVRGEWFHDLGFWFDPEYGTSGGSDTDLFRRMELAGARLVHERGGLVYEDVEAERCRPKAVVLRRYRAGAVFGRMSPCGSGIARHVGLLKRCAVSTILMAIGLPAALLGRPTTTFHGVCRMAVAIGIWRGHNQSYRVMRYPSAQRAPSGKTTACSLP